MVLSALACSPEDEDVLVIDRLELTSTKHAWTRTFEHVLVAVHFVLTDTLPRSGVDGSPFRSSDSASIHTVVAIDAFGVIHALEPLGGGVLFSLPALGRPVASAASKTSPELAIALADRLVVWKNGRQEEIAASATALAFVGDGLAYGSVDEVFGARGHLSDGAVERIVKDRDLVVVQRSETMLAVYRTAEAKPWKRVHYTERTITGFELLADRVLVVALDGGRTNRIDLSRGEVTRTGPGDWRVEVEDASAKPTEYVKGRIGHRRGVVAIIPVASAAALCVWTFVHRPPPAPLPPPRHVRPVAPAAPSGCNAACEADRLDALVAACKDAGCETTANDVREAFGVRRCIVAKTALEELSRRTPLPPTVGPAVASALDGLSACVMPVEASYGLLGLRDRDRPPLALAAPSQTERPIALAVDRDGYVYVATEASAPQRCTLYRREPSVDTSWTTILTVSGCSAGEVLARTETEVYFTSGSVVSLWNGASWKNIDAIDGGASPNALPPDLVAKGRVAVQRKPNDLFVGGDRGLFHYDGATWVTVLKDPVDLLAGNDRAVWVLTEAR